MIKRPILDNELKEHIASLADDSREIFLLKGGQVRLTAVSCTAMINEMRANHQLGVLETYILADAYIAAALLQSTIKGNDRIRLDVECGGPVKGLSVESWASGAVRGYLFAKEIKLAKPLETLNTSLLYGPGFLTITKILEGSKTPFSGQIMLEHGNLANDLALYFQQSEQTPTLFYLSLDYDKGGRIWGAGGLFIQALPGSEESVLESLQEKSKELSHLAKAISGGEKITDYVLREFKDYDAEHIGHSPIGFSCPCNKRSFELYLKAMGEKNKSEILSGTFPLEVECFNCSSVYSFSEDEVKTLFGEGL